MRKILIKINILVLFINIFLLSFQALASTGDTILDPIVDDTKEHNALQWTVQGVSSTQPLQAFVVGWYLTFTSDSKEITVYVPRDMSYWGSNSQTNTFPLTDEWKSISNPSNGIGGGNNSIKDFISDANKPYYESIITNPAGCQIEANAYIQKYTYNGSRPAGQQYLPADYNDPTNFARTRAEIDSNFSEFTPTFRQNTKDDYFEIKFALPPEKPKEKYTHTVKIQYWEDTGTSIIKRDNITQSDIVVTEDKGTSTTIIFTPTSITPAGSTLKSMCFKHDSSIPDTSSWINYSSWNKKLSFPLTEPNTVGYLNILIKPPLPDSGNIHTICFKYSDNSELSRDVTSTIIGTLTTINAPDIDGYTIKGSYLTYSKPSTTPSITNMVSGVLSQTVTLSSANQNAYVYFWYDEVKGPVAFIDGPTEAKAGESFKLSGARSYCKQSGATIVDYTWSNGTKGVSLNLSFNSPGDYTVNLTVTDSNGLTDTATHKITVAPPIPEARFNLAGKIKENRRITINATVSSSPEKYPIDWTKATWKIEPLLDTGATWDWGVKASNGLLVKANSTLNQSVFTGQSIIDFQARDSGQYKVTLTVTNTYPATDTYQGIITVAEDLLPIADYEIQKESLREYDNPVDSNARKYAIVPIIDKSYSPDGDYICKRIWCFRFNEANNKNADGTPIFSDDTTGYKFEGSPSTLFLPAERFRLVVDNDNDTNVQVLSYEVGQIFMQVIIEELIPDNETIAEFLLPSDKRVTSLQGW